MGETKNEDDLVPPTTVYLILLTGILATVYVPCAAIVAMLIMTSTAFSMDSTTMYS